MSQVNRTFTLNSPKQIFGGEHCIETTYQPMNFNTQTVWDEKVGNIFQQL